ncbi:hypothetical protein [Limnobacter sp.]
MFRNFLNRGKKTIASYVFQERWTKSQLFAATTLSAGVNYVLVVFLSSEQNLATALGVALLVKSLMVGHNSLIPNYLNPLVHNLINGNPVVWSSSKALCLSIIASFLCTILTLILSTNKILELNLILLFIFAYSLSLALYTNTTPLTKFKQRSDVALKASLVEFFIVMCFLFFSYFLDNFFFLIVAFPLKEIAKTVIILYALEIKLDLKASWPYELHKRFLNSTYVRNISLYGSQYFDKLLMIVFIPQQFLGSYIIGSTFGNIISIFGSNTFMYYVGQQNTLDANGAQRSIIKVIIISLSLIPLIYFSASFFKYSPTYATFGYLLVSTSSIFNALLVLFPRILQSVTMMFAFTGFLYSLIFSLMYSSEFIFSFYGL